MLISVGNDGNGKSLGMRVNHREANAIDRNGSFRYRDVFRRSFMFEMQHPTAVGIHHLMQLGRSIHVSLHQMAIQATSERRTTLQIHRVSLLPITQIRAVQRFLNRSDHKPFRILFHDRQTHPIVGNTLVNFQFVCESRSQFKMDVRPFLFDAQDLSYALDNACKHGSFV